jgi:hypothetical protein
MRWFFINAGVFLSKLTWVVGFFAWIAAIFFQLIISYFLEADKPSLKRYPSPDGRFIAIEISESAGTAMGADCFRSVWVLKAGHSEFRQLVDKKNIVFSSECLNFEKINADDSVVWSGMDVLIVKFSVDEVVRSYVSARKNPAEYSVRFSMIP